MTSLAQTKMIHTLRRQIPHYTDGDYRDYLRRNFKVVSTKELSDNQARRVIDELRTLAGQDGRVRRASETASGKYAPKLRALWISAYNLAIVRSRDDRAMLAFVRRQTGLDHTRFLTDAADARKAIEALKSWIARAGGVEWPAKDESEGYAETKRAVAYAVAKRCVEAGALKPFVDLDALPAAFERICKSAVECPVSIDAYKGADWDRLAARLGARLRAHLAKSARAA